MQRSGAGIEPPMDFRKAVRETETAAVIMIIGREVHQRWIAPQCDCKIIIVDA
jgi:hypothetical protein